MEHLVFMLWVLLFPLAMTANEYLEAKRHKMLGTTYEEPKDSYSLIVLVIWIVIALVIY